MPLTVAGYCNSRQLSLSSLDISCECSSALRVAILNADLRYLQTFPTTTVSVDNNGNSYGDRNSNSRGSPLGVFQLP